jgi:hypothetical protein
MAPEEDKEDSIDALTIVDYSLFSSVSSHNFVGVIPNIRE